MVWRLLLVGPGLMELRIILQQVLFTSCAAGASVRTTVSLGTLASTVTGGRRVALVRAMMASLRLALTTSASMLRAWVRRLARITVTTVSPSAALVLY